MRAPTNDEIAFDSVEVFDPQSPGCLRPLYKAWKKGEEGHPLDEGEREQAWEFERLWREALRCEDRKFLFRLTDLSTPSATLKKMAVKLRRFAFQALLKLSLPCTLERLKTEVSSISGHNYDEKTWRNLLKTDPFCDYPIDQSC